MANNLKILLLEDNPVDADLVEYELHRSELDFTLKKTDCREDFISGLEQFEPDLILSDFNLLEFNGLEALEITKKTYIDTPFILVTGNLDEETAVNCIKLGAWDYILKDKLTRLVPAIKNALKLKEEKKEKDLAIENLKKSEAKYQDLYDNAPDMFLSVNPKTSLITNCNQTLLKKLGYSREEFVGQEIYKFYTFETIAFAKEVLSPLNKKSGNLKTFELQVIKKDGSVIDVSLTNSSIYNNEGQIIDSISIWRDVTERKIMEQSLRKSEEKYRAMLEANEDIVIIKSADNSISFMNLAAKLKSKHKTLVNNCYEALFGLTEPCKDCNASNTEKIKTHHREIVDSMDNAIYLASYFPIKNIDGTNSIMCIYKDITSLRNIENERMRLLNILEATQNEIYIIDHINNNFRYVNESAVKNTLYSKNELITMSPYDIFVNIDNEIISEKLNSIDNKTDEKVVFEAEIRRKDKSAYPVEIHMQLIIQHNVKLILAVVIDIAERQKKEELILKLSKGIEQSPTTVVITDLKGNVEFINPKFSETSGYSFAEVDGKNLNILKSGYTPDSEYKILWQTITKGEIWQGEFLNKKKSGELYWEEAIIGPIKDKNNNITHFIGLKLEISNRKKIEEELKAEKNSLSKRVEERTADLSQLNAELAKAVRMKDEFLANMSHELRTPLNSILGLSEVLQDELYGPLNYNQQKSLKTIEDSGRHLLSLINDILDVAKVEAGKVELEIHEVSILSICQVSLNFIKQIALSKNISYSLKIDTSVEYILADERRLKQILINLLSNAVKFTNNGGSIGLTVQQDLLNESMNFTIWDKGIGITAENLTKLFKPFIQIDSSLSREYAGTGLGLTLVKSLTELHGGCVSIESSPGLGSSFTVSFPFKAYKRFDENTEDGDFQLFAQNKHINYIGKIFIIGKTSSDIQQLPLLIDKLELEYYLKSDNENLLKSILQFKPNIILIDIEFTTTQIWQQFEEIKSNEIASKIPIIVVSGEVKSGEILKKGISDYISRPITNGKMAKVILKYIKIPDKNNLKKEAKEKALILIAEDNENNIQMLTIYLQKLNYRLLVARNGREAVDLAEQKTPDIILMDIQMPGMDGIEATKIIRSDNNKVLANIPIIALTALAMPGDEKRCYEAGMTDYIKKPIGLKNLVIKIEEILSNHNTQ